MPFPADRRALLRTGFLSPIAFTAAKLGAALQPAVPVTTGIELALARRRAGQISHVRYDLSLDLTGPDAALGTVNMGFDRVGDSGDLVLDFRGPVLADLLLNGRPMPVDGRSDRS